MVTKQLNNELFSPYKRRIGFNAGLTINSQAPKMRVEDREAQSGDTLLRSKD